MGDKVRKVSAGVKQEMKYNLLPDSFGDRFDELETDWTEMSKQKFLSEAQKCEAADKKKQKLGDIPKKKRNADADTGSGVNRTQKAKTRMVSARGTPSQPIIVELRGNANSARWQVRPRSCTNPILLINVRKRVSTSRNSAVEWVPGRRLRRNSGLPKRSSKRNW